MPTRMLKMKPSLPLHLEHRLVTHWGYSVEARIPDQYTIFKKKYISDVADAGLKRTIRASVNKPATTTVETKIVWPDKFKPKAGNDELALNRKKQLEKECDNIVNFFPDPYSVPKSVRARLQIKQQRLTNSEAVFVQEYMDENFPEIVNEKAF